MDFVRSGNIQTKRNLIVGIILTTKLNLIKSFAITPEKVFEATTNSTELRQLVLKYGIRDEFREGIYCPETKVKILMTNKKISGIKIIGFRNSTTNFQATLNKPSIIDKKYIVDKKKVLEYVMTY